MIRNYFTLTKPGIIFGNAITAIAGFFLASHGVSANTNFLLLFEMLIGISFIIASGCVFNNYLDRNIDALMKRTKDRALVTGEISDKSAVIFGSITGAFGFFILAYFTNLLAVLVAFAGLFFYVVIYSIWKRRSVYGTIVGSISGAVPPIVGYTAVSNNIDLGAVILFFILVLWQMPHFYAIAIYRSDEYKSAGIPVLPVKKGNFLTKLSILFFIFAFLFTAPLLTTFGYTGNFYFYATLASGLVWLGFAIYGFWVKNDNIWARKMFLISLVILVLLSIIMSYD